MAKVGVTKGVRKILALCNKKIKLTKSGADAKRKRVPSSSKATHPGRQTSLAAFIKKGKRRKTKSSCVAAE